MAILQIEGLCKRYPSFYLDNVSFALETGYIMGFIGSNGAGKTTTLKSMINLVHKDSGVVTILGKDFSQNEVELKQDLGIMFGGVDFYSKHKIGQITRVVRRFYKNWDETIYELFLRRFSLDENKRIDELSNGMRVKYSLALALSHQAKLFLLDEPTSGLDPVARDDILELFQELVEDGNRSILFSTHITSDLEKCADYITYIKDGQIIESRSKDDLLESYRIVKGKLDQLSEISSQLIGYKTNAFGFTGLAKTDDVNGSKSLIVDPVSLEDIMIYYHRKSIENEKPTL
jgi:ABC-2 type transport system ATP-binding protein